MIPFPDPELADENGIVYVGGKLTVENLLAAYSRGIFPWPHEGLPLLWFSLNPRGVLFFKDFHVPRSFQKEMKKLDYKITFDQNFAEVMKNCGTQKRNDQPGTWINADMFRVYKEMFAQGHAHSVECWQGDKLVGGLYGVYVNGVFSGESMFFKESGASKLCLIAIVDRLLSRGHQWMDIQMVTPVLDLFGGEYISRKKYLKLLHETQKKQLMW